MQVLQEQMLIFPTVMVTLEVRDTNIQRREIMTEDKRKDHLLVPLLLFWFFDRTTYRCNGHMNLYFVIVINVLLSIFNGTQRGHYPPF